MTFGDMKTQAALALDNMQSDHPWYSSIGTHLNEAANAVLMMAYAKDKRAANVFPELRKRRWTDTTAAAEASFDLPSTLLVLESVTCTRDDTAYDPTTQREHPMSEIAPEDFAMLNKSATGWPILWTRNGGQISYYPTCSAGYETVMVIHGTRKESALTTDSQSYAMSDLWHPTVVKVAVGITLQNMGEHERANGWMDAADKGVTGVLNLVGLERIRNRVNVGISGMPR
jgi:hypothetical protein